MRLKTLDQTTSGRRISREGTSEAYGFSRKHTDVLGNAGGVYVSYLEWVGNRKRMQLTAEEEDHKLDTIMRITYDKVAKLTLCSCTHRCKSSISNPSSFTKQQV